MVLIYLILRVWDCRGGKIFPPVHLSSVAIDQQGKNLITYLCTVYLKIDSKDHQTIETSIPSRAQERGRGLGLLALGEAILGRWVEKKSVVNKDCHVMQISLLGEKSSLWRGNNSFCYRPPYIVSFLYNCRFPPQMGKLFFEASKMEVKGLS